MKHLFFSLLACVALAANPTFAQELAIGEPAPMTAAPLLATDGSQLTLTGLAKENGLLVIFLQHLPFRGWQRHENRRLGRTLQRPC